MPRINHSNAILQQSWDSRHEPTPKAFLDRKDVLNDVTNCLQNYVGRRSNIPRVTVTGPLTQNLDNMVRDTFQGGRRSCTNPKAVAGIIPWGTGSLENRRKPSIHYGRRQRCTIRTYKQRTRGGSTDGKIPRHGRIGTRANCCTESNSIPKNIKTVEGPSHIQRKPQESKHLECGIHMRMTTRRVRRAHSQIIVKVMEQRADLVIMNQDPLDVFGVDTRKNDHAISFLRADDYPGVSGYYDTPP